MPEPKAGAALKDLGLGSVLEIVEKPKNAEGLAILQRLWVVERPFAWMLPCRRRKSTNGAWRARGRGRSWPRAASCRAESQGPKHADNKQ